MTAEALSGPIPRVAASCFHCGSPVPASLDLEVVVDGKQQPVCCGGCKAAVQFILAQGLDDFYRLREAPTGTRPGEGVAADADAFTNPAVAAEFVSLDAPRERAQVSLALDGTHCAACAWVLENGLAGLPDLEGIRVDLASGRLHAVWRAADMTQAASHLGTLLQRINALGFDAVPARPSSELALHQRQRRRSLQAMGVAGIGSMQVMMLAVADYAGWFSGMSTDARALIVWGQMVLTTVVVLWGARPFFLGALQTLRARHMGIDVPVALAIGLGWGVSVVTVLSGGVARGEHVYFDSVAMFTFFLLLGRHLEQAARHRFARADAELESLLPSAVQRRTGTQGWESVLPAQLEPGDCIRVPPGGTVPADGRLLQDSASIDAAALTGEAALLAVVRGTEVAAGSRNGGDVLELEVLRPARASALAAIPQLLARARAQRPRTLHLADRVAGWLVTAVLAIATLTALVWGVLEPARVLPITLATLMVTCPCAFALATPVSLTAAAIRLRRAGILLVDSAVLERSQGLATACFDKTGTLTTPAALHCEPAAGSDEHFCQQAAAALEQDVPHPLARLFTAAAADGPPLPAHNVRLHAGKGVEGDWNGRHWRLGRPEWALDDASSTVDGDWIYLSADGVPAGRFQVRETLRDDAVETLQQLRAAGIHIRLMSGDAAPAVAAVAERLGIRDWQARMTPDDKYQALQQLRSQRTGGLLYVGDGLNDAPVLGSADVSVAMASACDFTRSAADAIILQDRLSGIAQLLAVASRARRIVRQNLAWALAYNLLAMPLAVTGHVAPWAAAIGMSASSLLVLGNALRLLGAPSSLQQRHGRLDAAWK